MEQSSLPFHPSIERSPPPLLPSARHGYVLESPLVGLPGRTPSSRPAAGRQRGQQRGPQSGSARALLAGVLGLLATLGTSAVHAELAICTTPQRPDCPSALPNASGGEFTFSRLIFADNQEAIDNLGDRIGYPHWQADCSESEPHFIAAMKRLTLLDTNESSQSISLLNEDIFDFPLLYVVEAGFASFSQPEADTLREYLLRGGFLLVDDFHGSYQYEQFEKWMGQVFPDRPVVDIPSNHEIFNVHFSIDEFIQIPGLRALCLNPGETWELPIMKTSAVNESNASRQQPHWRGVLDDDGRIMAIINWNMDLGDAWEHADMEEYSALYTATAYRLGVNYVLYGMTH